MKVGRRLLVMFTTLLVGAAGTLSFAPPAGAAKAEPTVSTLGWYWEDAVSREEKDPLGQTHTVETPNPFCPAAPGSLGAPEPTCASGRLPVEIENGDYESPDKISGVGFDLTLIPVGSKINSFKVTFREAKSGCYDTNNDDRPNYCEETDPKNVEGHKLKACLVEAYFGDGEARPYKEAPKYVCPANAPVATRKKLDIKDGEGSDNYWTFDLTSYAQNWVKSFTTTTAIMLVGVPKNKNDEESWRVVLTGPKFQNGLETPMDYIPADDPVPPVPPGGGGIPPTGGTGEFGTGTGSTGDFGTGAGTGTTGTGTGTTTATPGASPSPSLPPAAGGADSSRGTLPGYVWLALLAGLLGFSAFRSVVLERVGGIRPDGVLAQIQRLNAQRRGGVPAAAAGGSSGALAGLGSGVRNIAGKVGGAFSKLTRRGS